MVRPNFPAAWDEVGSENQVEETFALSTVKDVPGEREGGTDRGREREGEGGGRERERERGGEGERQEREKRERRLFSSL